MAAAGRSEVGGFEVVIHGVAVLRPGGVSACPGLEEIFAKAPMVVCFYTHRSRPFGMERFPIPCPIAVLHAVSAVVIWFVLVAVRD